MEIKLMQLAEWKATPNGTLRIVITSTIPPYSGAIPEPCMFVVQKISGWDHDWVIFFLTIEKLIKPPYSVHSYDLMFEAVLQRGDQVFHPDIIQNLFPCVEEVLAFYRFQKPIQ